MAAMAPEEPASGPRAALLRLAAWVRAGPRRERVVQVAAAALAFEGFALMLVAPKVVIQHPVLFWVGAAFVALGGLLLLLPTLERVLGGAPRAAPTAARPVRDRPAGPMIADRLVARLTRDGKLNYAYALFGAAIIGVDLLYNQFLSPTPWLSSNDYALMGFGAALVAFPFVPTDFARERNFALLFFGALAAIFVVPLIALNLGADAGGSVDEYTATLVTPQLAGLLDLLGNPVVYIGNDVYYQDLSTGRQASVHIATQCSGLYSMAIFIAAFVALVATDYPRVTRRVGALLCAGVFLAYLANLLRMVVIVEAGHYYGSQALLSTHANLGDIIFLAWVGPFMWLAYRFLDPRAEEREGEERARFRAALRARGVDPDSVSEDDWFCGSCFERVEAPDGKGPPVCPACGAAL